MIDIWEEVGRFNTNYRLIDKENMILKQGCFSELEAFEILQQINRETYQQDSNTVSETLNTDKLESSNQIETRSNSN